MAIKSLQDEALSVARGALLLGALASGCQRDKEVPSPAPAPSIPPEEGIPLSQLKLVASPRVSASKEQPIVIPQPKELAFLEGRFMLRPETALVLPSNPTPVEQQAITVLQEALKARLGQPLKIVSAPTSNAIVLGGARHPETPQKPEGYMLTVRPQGVQLCGNDAQGLFWAVQTLLQLFVSKTEILSANIRDWPTLSLRAVHLFHGSRALPFHQKLISRLFSPLKLNALFLEVEQVRWDTDPSVAPAWAGTKEQLRQELDFARAHNLTVYPLLQSLGHMGWLLGRASNTRYAEDPATPYALCLSDPGALKYVERFVTEADELFRAPAFHVGLDEVMMRGRFPYRSRPTPAPELFLKGVRHWHDFFAARGKPICLWADMALYAPEVAPSFGTARRAADATKIRAGIPRDVILADWQYGEHDDFPSLRQLKAAGFPKLVAATWHRNKNIQTLSRTAAQVGAQGLIQTTWCGYESSEDVLKTQEKRQFTAMVLAAEYFWNGGGPTPEALPFSADAIFNRQWES